MPMAVELLFFPPDYPQVHVGTTLASIRTYETSPVIPEGTTVSIDLDDPKIVSLV